MWGDTVRTKSGAEKLVNVANKERRLHKGERAYAVITDRQGWKWSILKSWQADNSKEYSRWFVRVQGDFDEMGDEYCSTVRAALRDALAVPQCVEKGLLVFDESVWPTVGNFCAWAWGEL